MSKKYSKALSIETDSWEVRENAIQKALEKASKKSDSELLENLASKPTEQERKDMDVKCGVINRIVNEALEEYREGEWNYKKTIQEIISSLTALK